MWTCSNGEADCTFFIYTAMWHAIVIGLIVRLYGNNCRRVHATIILNSMLDMHMFLVNKGCIFFIRRVSFWVCLSSFQLLQLYISWEYIKLKVTDMPAHLTTMKYCCINHGDQKVFSI